MSERGIIGAEKRYEFVTGRLQYHNDKITEALNRYWQFMFGIVFGSIWFARGGAIGNSDWLISDILVGCLSILTITTIVVNVMAWWGFRKAECALNAAAPKVRHLRSYWPELVRVAIIIVFTGLFLTLNPLQQR